MFLSDIEVGTSIFIDANIFIYHFSKESRFNHACSNFLEYIETESINGVTSLPVIQEVTHRMMIIEAAARHPEVKPKDMMKYLKANPEKVKKLTRHQEIPSRIDSLNVKTISLDLEMIKTSQLMKRRYGFLSNDSLTLQIMEDLKIKNLASNDTDFERVDFIKLFRPSEYIVLPK